MCIISLIMLISLLALYPGGIPRREPPSCEAPREPTIYVTDSPCEKYDGMEVLFHLHLWDKFHVIIV